MGIFNIKPITNQLHNKLQIFCDKCNKLGYTNNGSFKAMKLEWCKDWGEYYCAIKDDEIFAVGGCHPLPEVDKDGWRINFRGCELPNTSPYKGLSKGNWTSVTWRDFVPVFIDYCPTNKLYITSNISNEHSGKALRTHKKLFLLEKQNMVSKVCDMVLYSTDQTVWKLNIEEFTKRRNMLND